MYIAMYILFPSNLSSKHCAPFSEGGVSGGSIGLPGFVHKSPRVLTSGLPLLLDLKPVRRRAVAWLLPPPPVSHCHGFFSWVSCLSVCLCLFVFVSFVASGSISVSVYGSGAGCLSIVLSICLSVLSAYVHAPMHEFTHILSLSVSLLL